MWIILGILAPLAVVVAGIYFWVQKYKLKDYWSKKGFMSVDIPELYGCSQIRAMFGKLRIAEIDSKIYSVLKKNKEPFGGCFDFSRPLLYVRDIELLKHIFVKDFDHFVDRRDFHVDEFTAQMLFFRTGERWRDLRVKMTPTFTSRKIRIMFGIMEKSCERLIHFLSHQIKTTPKINLADGYGKLTVDVISSAAFGLESGAFDKNKSIFIKSAEKLTVKMTFKSVIKFLIIFMMPKIASALRIPFLNADASKFFRSMIASNIKHREETGEKRDDFLQLMLETRAQELKTEEAKLSDQKVVEQKSRILLTHDVICAQSVIFFLGAFDTTQSLLQFATYHLAIAPDIQDKLLDEVVKSFNNHGNNFTYESIQEMEYMDKFISETLRMYPPNQRLDRTCTKDYTIPGTKLVIPAGTTIFIPHYAIHHDEDIYPHPSTFDPERFSKEAKAARSPYTFLPFGYGPRNCIGSRFALTEVKLVIARLVQNFIIAPSDKTQIPIKFSVSPTLKPDGGLWLNLKARKNY